MHTDTESVNRWATAASRCFMCTSFCPADEPDPPQNVWVRCYDQERRAEIFWQAGRENFAPILNYYVQFNTTFAQVGKWETENLR